MSLKPPFFALASGVRMARVMTMSSAFLEVLPGCLAGSAFAHRPCMCVPARPTANREDLHRGQGAAWGQVLEDGAQSFYSHGWVVSVCVVCVRGLRVWSGLLCLLWMTEQKRSRRVSWVVRGKRGNEGGRMMLIRDND